MNQDTIKGQWHQLKGQIKQRWGQLTEDDLQRADGNREYLVGKIQERCGVARDQAEREVKDFESTIQA